MHPCPSGRQSLLGVVIVGVDVGRAALFVRLRVSGLGPSPVSQISQIGHALETVYSGGRSSTYVM